MPTPNGSHNQPLWDLADDADFATDLSALSNYVATVANIKIGTTTQRDALSGLNVWNGLAFRNTTDGRTYYYDSSLTTWVLETWGALVTGTTTASGNYRGNHGLGKTPSGVSFLDDARGSGAIPGQRGYSITELGSTQYVFKMIRVDTGGSLGSNPFTIFVTVVA